MRRFVSVSLILAGLLVTAAAPPPDPDAPPPLIVPPPSGLSWSDVLQTDFMHYAIIPNGKVNVLFVWGKVENGASVRFRAALDAAKPIDEVVLYSQGGNLDEGLEIGRLIHARHLATHVVRGQRCVSACNFMFMGGTVRYVDSGAQFTVHMFSDDEANDLRRDLVSPPKSYQSLLKKYPSLNVEALLEALADTFPVLKLSSTTFEAAVGAVRQQNQAGPDDDDDAVDLEAMRKIIADYNHDHPDNQISEQYLIMKIMLDEDVKRIQMGSAQTAAGIARFLTEMGLSLKFLTRFAEIHNDRATPLTRQELREFNVMNTD